MIEKDGYVIVEKGDTLSAISSKVGMSTTELQRANPAIKDIDKIYEKQKIKTKPKKVIKKKPPTKDEESKPIEKNDPIKKAKKTVEQTPNEPDKNSEAMDCCCMLEEWTLEEKDRKFKLEVVKEEKWLKSDDLSFKGNNKNPRANRKNYRKKSRKVKLYVVTSPASPNGNVTYKEITSNHKFKKKKCDLYILAKKGEQEVVLQEGDVLEVDSNGDIVEQVKRKEKEVEKYTPPVANFQVVNIATPSGQRIKAYEDRQKQTPYMDNHTTAEMESYPIFEDIPNMPQDKSSFVTLIKTLVNPYSIVEEPIVLKAQGSSKCLNKTVIIYPIEHLEADIEMIIDFGLIDKLKATKNTLDRASKKDTFEVIESSFKIEGKGVVKRGSQSFEFAKDYEKENSKKVTRKEAKSFFHGIRQPISKFYDLFNEAESKKNKNTIFSFSPGNSQFFVKMTGLKIVESQEDYGRDWEGKVEVAIVLFNGSGGKLDLINLIVSRGNGKISTFVEECRERLKKGYKSEYIEGNIDLEANLVLSGGITGMVSWDKKIGKDVVAEGEVSGEVSLALETKIHLEGRVWELKASVGAELKTTSEDSGSASAIKASLKATKGTNGADLDWTGDLKFTGFGIYWGMYAELKWKKDKSTSDSSSSERNSDEAIELKTPKYTTEGSLVLLKEHSFWSKVMHDMPNQTYRSDVPSYLLK
jgi:murein DD-endopeptidase MepM/ murein hydrolase activator NlpD